MSLTMIGSSVQTPAGPFSLMPYLYVCFTEFLLRTLEQLLVPRRILAELVVSPGLLDVHTVVGEGVTVRLVELPVDLRVGVAVQDADDGRDRR